MASVMLPWVEHAEDMYPEEWESLRYHIHPQLGREPVFTLEPLWESAEPYVVPDDPVDYVVGFAAVVLVIGALAYFAGPLWAGAYVVEPGSMTVTFFAGVVVSNWMQEQIDAIDF